MATSNAPLLKALQAAKCIVQDLQACPSSRHQGGTGCQESSQHGRTLCFKGPCDNLSRRCDCVTDIITTEAALVRQRESTEVHKLFNGRDKLRSTRCTTCSMHPDILVCPPRGTFEPMPEMVCSLVCSPITRAPGDTSAVSDSSPRG